MHVVLLGIRCGVTLEAAQPARRAFPLARHLPSVFKHGLVARTLSSAHPARSSHPPALADVSAARKGKRVQTAGVPVGVCWLPASLGRDVQGRCSTGNFLDVGKVDKKRKEQQLRENTKRSTCLGCAVEVFSPLESRFCLAFVTCAREVRLPPSPEPPRAPPPRPEPIPSLSKKVL